MPRQDEPRNLNRRRNQSYGRDPGSDVDRINTNRKWDIDRDRLNLERSGRDSDYYSERDEERRFGKQDRGWGQEDQRVFGYGNTNRMNDWRSRDYGSTRYETADRYGENIGNQGLTGDSARFYRSEQRGSHFGKGPKGWKLSDDRIKEEASEALYRDPQVDASEIDLSVKDGRVYLRGSVDSREAKRHAEECVENLSGVDDVQNELRVNRETNKNISETKPTNLS